MYFAPLFELCCYSLSNWWVSRANVPLTGFQLNSKFCQNLDCFYLKCAQVIITKICTGHETVTVVTCADCGCHLLNMLWTKILHGFVKFRIPSKYRYLYGRQMFLLFAPAYCTWNYGILLNLFIDSRFVIFPKKKANLRDLIAVTCLVISNWIQIVSFSTCVTVKFDGWPRETIGHFFYTTSSFVHHFKSIGEFTLDLQSRNAQFGSKLVICYPMWPWNLMDDLKKIGHLFYATSSFVQHFVAIGEFKLELQVGNAQSGSNSTIFRAVRPWNLTNDLAKQ